MRISAIAAMGGNVDQIERADRALAANHPIAAQHCQVPPPLRPSVEMT
jgi:hypothetical protein